MTKHSEAPVDLIDLQEAEQLLGPAPMTVMRLIQAGILRVHHVNRTVWVSRQQLIDYRFRSAGLIPAAEWAGPDS
ncbi:Uncharacterised protein [Mycobacteroides abscessus subsp. abscessus]|uniref:hypothetical protein n=1 Tax=Mycobacteroides abscessus TaxID=36809 RepID=UPI0009A751C4|nr:hypothetical protein [Mycobacteroides abscessus]SLJ23642.1 Uncharacterised protein [Mycobacteroides abscessus subsp. abscessus]